MSHPPVCTCYLDVSVKFFTGLSTVEEADSSVSNKGKSGWPESSVILQKEDTKNFGAAGKTKEPAEKGIGPSLMC